MDILWLIDRNGWIICLKTTPCYTSIIIYGIITAILLTISAILKSLIKQKKNSNE